MHLIHDSAAPMASQVSLYCALDWHMTPIKGKKPILKGWVNNASNAPGQVNSWLEKGHNLGLVTGSKSGVVVIDVDPRNGGRKTLSELEAECGPLPQTVTCNTGGGGEHYYFQYYEGAKSTKTGGIDFQCDGKCVVMPPSIHPDTGALYEWAASPSEAAIAVLPDKWRTALASSAPRSHALSRGQAIPEGERNESLFRIGIELAKSEKSDSEIHRELAEENQQFCNPPLDPNEVHDIAKRCVSARPSNASFKTKWQHFVWDSRLNGTTKIVLGALASWARVDGTGCYPTLDQIGARASCTRKTAGKALELGEELGLIVRFTHKRPVGPGFNYSYRLTLPPKDEYGVHILPERWVIEARNES